MISQKIRFSFLAVFLVAALFVNQVVFAQGPVLLELKQKPGDVNQYGIRMSGKSKVSSGGESHSTNMDIKMLMRWKVVKVGPSGTMDVSVTISEGSSTINNEPVDLPNLGDTKLMKISRRGKIINVTPDDPNIDYKSMQVEFPEKSLSIGDSWVNTVTLGPEYPVPMEAKYTLTGFESIKGHECAVIESKIKILPLENAPEITIDVDAVGRLYFAYKEGRMIKNEVKSLMKMIMPVETQEAGGAAEVQMNMSMNMVMELR